MNVTKQNLVDAFKLWNTEMKEHPDEFLSSEEYEALPSEASAQISADYLYKLLKEVKDAKK